ncbi:hypothetical protein M6B38_187025 [Iris pallida]|uniref:Uncharacterized protein n=1 Tax=Iris pallida TaxID=29817 RepID=A0AAX6EJB0_IRIPA|nr:hypothetical protein M6B38_187025 [Iris pallida]
MNEVVFHYAFESQTVSNCVLSCSMETELGFLSPYQVLYKGRLFPISESLIWVRLLRLCARPVEDKVGKEGA